MGTAHIEIYAKYNKNQAYPCEIKPDSLILAVDFTSSTTSAVGATCPQGAGRDYWAKIIHDEACYVLVGDGTPVAVVPPGLSYKTIPNVALELPIRAGQKIAFKEVA